MHRHHPNRQPAFVEDGDPDVYTERHWRTGAFDRTCVLRCRTEEIANRRAEEHRRADPHGVYFHRAKVTMAAASDHPTHPWRLELMIANSTGD